MFAELAAAYVVGCALVSILCGAFETDEDVVFPIVAGWPLFLAALIVVLPFRGLYFAGIALARLWRSRVAAGGYK